MKRDNTAYRRAQSIAWVDAMWCESSARWFGYIRYRGSGGGYRSSELFYDDVDALLWLEDFHRDYRGYSSLLVELGAVECERHAQDNGATWH